MRKKILLLIAITAASLNLNAQIHVRISAGAASGLIYSPASEFVFDRPQDLYGIYGELYVLDHCSPLYQLDVSKQLRENIVAGLSIGTSNASGYKRGVNNVNNLSKKRVHDYLLMGHTRVKYYSGGDFYLYCGAALGVGFKYIEEISKKDNDIFAAYELSPIGISIGTKRFSVFVEGAVGSVINGCRAGLKLTI